MRFSRFGKKHAQKGDQAEVAQVGGASCFHSQCVRTEGWQCTYTDTHGTVCATWWCRDHIEFVSGAPFCRRHAGLARMLLERVGSLYQIPVPAVSDRALPLLIRLTGQTDEPFVKLLRHLYSGNAQVQVAPQAMIRERKERGNLGWEAVWTASSAAGYLTTFVLRVTADEPPVAQLLRDGRMVHEGVPGWIANRNEDGWHSTSDAEFVGSLYNHLVASFTDSPALAG